MKQKVALITGSNRGIGLAVAKSLLAHGHKVVITARKEMEAQKAQLSLKNLGDVYCTTLDVSDVKSILDCRNYVEDQFGKLDILVNNAGINYDTWQTTLSADLEEVRQTFDTNVFGAWKVIQEFVPLMKDSSHANIVNVSSGAGALSSMSCNTPGYSMSKAALNVMTIQFSKELRPYNIVVNAVCPGWVRTDMGGDGAPRSPEEGAETIVWASELEDRNITGKFFRDKKEIEW
ncbi:SDR family oxidoreductase [Aureibacter tunicatorum]|uniref:NAD(P)-dependent dehydrogenase (Short-subunit alcohol dehydrogenase family) n=1 Tax=Aureibacter tunicatorum TaxID=866807 RepID=A0AAE3XQA6_9BACT|nr:SDR family oxidoreductase [Aureibacter tunicatorum]MDR6240753.1 NAD(P)-dependent dehydrogenase (short-subunit alcohol dehydrogenase family) [Aureibacter tunicatorum]BDD06914.1 short-chain dehydrogenase [Aureibacter tunicatorum]